MQSTFWSNTIWYILLGISSIFQIIIIFTKAKNRKLIIALLCTVSGMTFTFEAAIMFFLKSYEYYPMILPQLPLDDMIAGNLISQFSVTATALLIAVLNQKYYWYFIYAGIYSAIEESFIKLGIYSHNWYKTWMTFVGFVLLSLITKRIYKNSLIHVGRILRLSYIFFGLVSLYLITIIWIFKLSGILDFNMNILPDAMRSYASLTLSNMLFTCITCMIIYFSKLRHRWKSIILIALYVVVFIECKVNIIYIKKGWFLIYTTIDIWGTYLYVFMLDKLYGHQIQKKHM